MPGFWQSLIVSNSNSIRHIYPTRDRSERSIFILELNFVYFVICRLCKCYLLRFLQVLFCLVFGNSTFICVIITLIIIILYIKEWCMFYAWFNFLKITSIWVKDFAIEDYCIVWVFSFFKIIDNVKKTCALLTLTTVSEMGTL